jgi:small-conductance mechanosensitive channel
MLKRLLVNSLVAICLFVAAPGLFTPGVFAAEATALAGASLQPAGVNVAPVVIDGETLFHVRGLSAIPAQDRANQIRERVIAVAEDPAIDPADSAIVEAAEPGGVALEFGGRHVVTLFPMDAKLEAVPLEILVEANLRRLTVAITNYREARTPERLMRSTGVLVAITALAALLVWACLALHNGFRRVVEQRAKRHIERLEQASHRIIHSGQLWAWFGALARALNTILMVAIVLTWANTALGLYPWTRPFAAGIFQLVLDPLRKMGLGIVQSVPDIAFLVILALLVRFILGAMRTFFLRVDRGWIRLESFEREWAMPTYRIVRVAIIAFAVVVAYPYIPGSDSEAFKGLGILMGVVLSIGSTSFIANMVAGYSLTYRAAYRVGDRVQIGEHLGEVVDIRTQNTRLRSLKNEEVNIPNSIVLSSAVVNYSAYQRDPGVILHTEVGIGYDTPWRQVEAMLLMAADRTEGLLRDPAPFVLQRSLGDFTVIYELNAHCSDASRMAQLYSDLHGHIQDVFNEYGVQIMSPNYEQDPELPKVVSPGDFYAAPASPPPDQPPA